MYTLNCNVTINGDNECNRFSRRVSGNAKITLTGRRNSSSNLSQDREVDISLGSFGVIGVVITLGS